MLHNEAGSGSPAGHSASGDRAVAGWLFLCSGAIVAMIVIGGITRLTESGLSMVEWRPLIGMLPPMSVVEWERIFDLYRETPEFRVENPHIALDDFKAIFWWEYIHRMWGRLIGIVFAAGFLWLLRRKQIDRRLLPHLVGLFLLGALQGVIGWWMVRSGFADRTDVSQYRLAIHLGMAFAILGYMLWLALTLIERPRMEAGDPASGYRLALAILCVASVTVLSGGLTAGLDAGFIYNTWPLMGGSVTPAELFVETPIWSNFFENPATVQFDHRILAYLTTGLVITLWLRERHAPRSAHAARAMHVLLAVVALQITLGISTLLLVVPLLLAVAHQAGAIALFGAAVWTTHALR